MGLRQLLTDAVPLMHLTFQPGDFRMGGLVAESPDLGLRVDASFDSAAEELSGHFAELFGLSLSDESRKDGTSRMKQAQYTIHGINGPVVTVVGGRGLAMMDMVSVGDEGLIGEVVGVDLDAATVQVYEDTAGLKPGQPAVAAGGPHVHHPGARPAHQHLRRHRPPPQGH